MGTTSKPLASEVASEARLESEAASEEWLESEDTKFEVSTPDVYHLEKVRIKRV